MTGQQEITTESAESAELKGSELFDTRRKHKFDADRKRQMVDLIAEGCTRTEACRTVGVNIATLERHERKYPAFAAAIREAERGPNDAVVKALYDAALSGNVKAQEIWLYNKMPHEWAAKVQVIEKHEIDGESVAEFVEILQIAGVPPDVMDRIRAEVQRRAAT